MSGTSQAHQGRVLFIPLTDSFPRLPRRIHPIYSIDFDPSRTCAGTWHTLDRTRLHLRKTIYLPGTKYL